MIGLLALLAACSQSPAELLIPSAQAQDATAPAARLYGLGGTLYVQVYKDPNTIAARRRPSSVVNPAQRGLPVTSITKIIESWFLTAPKSAE